MIFQIYAMLDKIKVDYSCLFQLHDPLAKKPIRVQPHSDSPLSQEETRQLFYGTLQPRKPIRLVQGMGKQISDFLWSTFHRWSPFPDKIVNILESHNFTGWGYYPVELYNSLGMLIPGYQGFSIISYAGGQDFSRSELITIPSSIPEWKDRQVYKGTYFDESKWNGSDFFRIQHATIIVKKEVVTAFQKSRISNVRFTPLLGTELDSRVYDSLKRIGGL